MTSSINSILSKHGVTLSKKKSVTKKSVKPNPINVGGKQGEDLAENDIIRSGLSFRRQSKRPKMKVHYGDKAKDYDYNARKKQQSEEIDRILDKLKKSGYNSLTTEEKKSLFDASKK